MEHTMCIDSEAKITETHISKSTIAYICINTSFDPPSCWALISAVAPTSWKQPQMTYLCLSAPSLIQDFAHGGNSTKALIGKLMEIKLVAHYYAISGLKICAVESTQTSNPKPSWNATFSKSKLQMLRALQQKCSFWIWQLCHSGPG